MPTFTGKAFANFYKNILGVNQTTNTGVDATTRAIQDGAGNDTVISLSDDVLQVKPADDNTTGTLAVQNNGGSNILAVDTTNSLVKTGASQVSATTQYTHFGIDNASSSAYAADIHYAIPFMVNNSSTAILNAGSSTSSSFNDTNPATSVTISTTGNLAVQTYWYVMDDITIDAVKWLHSADAATGDVTAGHLMAYDIVTDNSSTSGDLSNGIVVADGSNITNAGYEQIYYQAMTVQSANVDAGKVILFTFASDTINSDFSINATVKFHIR